MKFNLYSRHSKRATKTNNKKNFYYYNKSYVDIFSPYYTIDFRNLSIYFLLSLSQDLSSFHLNEELHGFYLTYPNWQNHDSCDLVPLLNELRVS